MDERRVIRDAELQSLLAGECGAEIAASLEANGYPAQEEGLHEALKALEQEIALVLPQPEVVYPAANR